MKRRFLIANELEILEGRTTDVFFSRTAHILKRRGLDWTQVVAEFTSACLPGGWPCSVFAGLDEVLDLLTGKEVDVYAIPEGTVIPSKDVHGTHIPVMDIRGPYGEFCEFETPALGLICQSSGVATKAARVRQAAGDREVLSLGVRRMHPALAPMMDYYAYMGGCDSISTRVGAEVTGTIPRGTMPHAFFVVVGDSRTAFEMFHTELEDELPRIALVDTYTDDRHEAVAAAEAIGQSLEGVRLNLAGRGVEALATLVQEVRRELNDRGFDRVKVYVSGGLDEEDIPPLVKAGAEGFGVGTAISNAPTINYTMDIVSVEGKAHDLPGRPGGVKEVFRCQRCLSMSVTSRTDLEGKRVTAPTCQSCGEPMELLTAKVMEAGRRTTAPEGVGEKRERVMDEMRVISGS